MPRYILIDSNSGFIFGDTAQFERKLRPFISEDCKVGGSEMSPTQAARVLDEETVGEFGRSYIEHSRIPSDTRSGYAVYRADVNGSDAVAAIIDGQDQEMIEAVERDCEFVCFVECATAAA